MSPEDAEIAQEIIRSEDEKVSVAYGQKLKVARQKLIKKYGKGWAKMVESNLEESSKNKALVKDLEKLIKNPDPSRVKEYGGGTKYVDMLKSKLAKLQEDNTEISEASKGDIEKILKFAAKNGGKRKGNIVDFGGSKIEFSLDKGKIKFDGGKDSGVEQFDNLRDAISALSIGLED